MADAQISIGADAGAVERAAAVAKAAWRDVGSSITSSIGAAGQAVVSDLSNVALAMGKVSFSSQHAQVREFEAATAHLAVATGASLDSVRAQYEATGVSIGKRPAEVAAWVKEVGRLTYSYENAGQAIKGISALAAETGRSVDDYRGLATTLGTVGHVAGDTSHVIGVMQAQVDKLGNAGGIAAFADQMDGLSEVISHFAMKSEGDFTKVSALAAELGKGLSPQAAQRVQQQAFSTIASDPYGWSRVLGRDITDEHGQIAKPTEVLRDVVQAITHGRHTSEARRQLMLQFGPETGSQLFNTDFKAAAANADLPPSVKAQKAQEDLLKTDAGKRDVAQAELAKSARDLLGSSSLLGQAADKLQQFAAHNPISSTLIATAIGGAMGNFMTTFGKSIALMMGGKGAGGAVGGLVDLATKGTGAGSATLKAIPVLGSFVGGLYAGGEMGGAIDEWQTQTFDKPREAQEKATRDQETIRLKEIRDRVRAAKGLATLPGGYTPSAEDSAMARAAAGGSKEAVATFSSQLQKEGESKVDAERIARAVAEGVAAAMKNVKVGVEVTQAPDSSVTVTEKTSQSAAAGHQG